MGKKIERLGTGTLTTARAQLSGILVFYTSRTFIS